MRRNRRRNQRAAGGNRSNRAGNALSRAAIRSRAAVSTRKKRSGNEGQATAPVVISLKNTLDVFGEKIFDMPGFIHQELAEKGSKRIGENLHTQSVLLNESTKGYVTEHYEQFIHTAKEIQFIESDMSQLYNLISSFQSRVIQMQDIKFGIKAANINTEDVEGRPFARKKAAPNQKVLALEELNEDLSSRIYERKFEQAVSTIEEGWDRIEELTRDEKKPAQKALRNNMDELCTLLTSILDQKELKLNERRRLIGYIIRIDRIELALKVFFQQRNNEVLEQFSQIRLQKDLNVYITDISGIAFSAIHSASIEFRRLFQHRSFMAVFVSWILRQLTQFVDVFHQRVFLPHISFRSVCQCIHLSLLACKMLEEGGISLSFVLEHLFEYDFRRAFHSYISQLRVSVSQSVSNDSWHIEQAWIQRSSKGDKHRPLKLFITKSSRFLYDIVHQYMVNMKLVIFDTELFDPTVNDLRYSAVSGLRQLFEEYLLQMTAISKSKEVSDEQGIAIVANSFYLSSDLFPRIRKQLNTRLHKNTGMSDIASFHEQLIKFYKAQRDFFCQRRGQYWLDNVIEWNKCSLNWYSTVSSDIPHTPSAGFMAFAQYLDWLHKNVKLSLGDDVALRMKSRAVAEVFSLLRNSNEVLMSSSITSFGLRQLFLDIEFCHRLGIGHYLDSIKSYGSRVVDKLLLHHVSAAAAAAATTTTTTTTDSGVKLTLDATWIHNALSHNQYLTKNKPQNLTR